MPKVTVAIPTYNRKDYLRECIKSVLGQTFQDFQIIVFDNHSDYNVAEFLNEFKDDRIALISSPTNTGNADRVFVYPFMSPYVIMFHDDDVMHPELLQKEVDLLDAHESLVWVATNLRFIKDHKTIFDFPPIKNKKGAILSASEVVRLILSGFNLCYDSVMYRSGYISGVPSYDLYSKWGDRPYLVDLLKDGKAGIIDEPLVNYRIHAGQDSQGSSQNKVQYAINLLLFYKKHIDSVNTFADKKLFYAYVANNVIPSAFTSARTIPEFFALLNPYRQADLLRPHYINFRGIYRSFRAITRRVCSNLKK